MKKKEILLTHDWTVVIPETFSVFVSFENPNQFSIHDNEDDQHVLLITKESSIVVDKNGYDEQIEVNIANRSFILFPNSDEE